MPWVSRIATEHWGDLRLDEEPHPLALRPTMSSAGKPAGRLPKEGGGIDAKKVVNW